MEKYSVLMSVYSKEKPEYLKISIESMLSQTVLPDQFVLVKDGPLTKDLDTIIANYVSSNKEMFTIVELKENKGLGIALDEGLKHCKNDLVARMDSDDISLPDRCEKELWVFDKHPELAIVSGNIGEFIDDPNHIVSIRSVPENQEQIKKRMRIRSAFNHPAVMYRKKDVLRCGGYGNLKRKQDHVLFSHMLNSGYQAYNIQKVMLLFRADRDSISRKKSLENCRGYIEAQAINFKRGECRFIDFIFVIVIQIIVFTVPQFVVEYLRKFIRRLDEGYGSRTEGK